MGNANGEVGDPWLSAGFYNPNATPDRDNPSPNTTNDELTYFDKPSHAPIKFFTCW